MPTNNDQLIKHLVDQIEQLKLSTDRKIKNLQNQVQRLQTETSNQSTNKTSTFTGHLDRNGVRIHIGDKVLFLTSGKYDSTTGVVSSSNNNRVFTLDDEGRTITRAPHNLSVLPKKEKKKRTLDNKDEEFDLGHYQGDIFYDSN